MNSGDNYALEKKGISMAGAFGSSDRSWKGKCLAEI